MEGLGLCSVISFGCYRDIIGFSRDIATTMENQMENEIETLIPKPLNNLVGHVDVSSALE